jgi:Mn-dependent DtxR family transcriptional regulator
MTQNTISAALGDYLETIYVLSLDNPAVRITDVARRLGISKPSANRAVNSLKERDYVSHEPYGDILLTESGRRYAEEMYRRHRVIKNFLVEVLESDEDEAERESRLIEHSVSSATVEKIESFVTRYLT